MSVFDRMKQIWRGTRHQDRRAWRNASRVHLETHHVPRDLRQSFAASVEAAFAGVPSVRWARFNAPMSRVVIEVDPEVTIEALEAKLNEVEQRYDIHLSELPDDGRDHPADIEPLDRTRLEIGADLLGLSLGISLRLANARVLPAEVDFAAVLAALQGMPGARKAVEDQLGKGTAELVLNMGNALSSALIQGVAGPSIDAVHRYLRARELDSRRAVWEQIEAKLSASPSAHPADTPHVAARPVEIEPGVIEAYADKALFGTMGSFGLGLASSGSLQGATASIFAGIPKPAFLGREAFSLRFSEALAKRGALVIDRSAIRLFDRVDTIVFDGALFAAQDEDAPDPDLIALVAEARRSGARIRVAGSDDWAISRHPLPGGQATGESIRELQSERHTVLYMGREATGHAAADVSLGFISGDWPPWSASVICTSLRDARYVVAAVAAAKQVASQSVRMAIVEVATGLLLSLGGLRGTTVRRVMLAANGASLLSIANGVRVADQIPAPPTGAGAPLGAWHRFESAEVLRALGSTRDGLDAAKAAERRVPPPPDKSSARQLGELMVDELSNPLTPVLAAGAGLSFLTGSVLDGLMVSGVVGVNTVMGAGQRFRTERQLKELFAEEQHDVRVLRAGHLETLDRNDLVWGDVVSLHAGEAVPADCRILEAHGLEVDESPLTGESLPVHKSAAPTDAKAVAERTSMLYAGTTIAAGEVVAVVTACGADTEALRGAWMQSEAPVSGVEKRLETLTNITAPIAAAAGLTLVAAGTAAQAKPRDVLASGVSLAVAAVPEGLPLLATTAQLSAAKRLADQGAVVRNPRGIEALGRVNVLCADKTGTLTEGRIRLQQVYDGLSRASVQSLDEHKRRVIAVAARATPTKDGGGPHLTDRALVEGAAQSGVLREHGATDWQSRHQLRFEPGRAYHAVAGETERGGLLCVKGAPEILVQRCVQWRIDGEDRSARDDDRQRWMAEAEAMARQGLRVLAVADRRIESAREVVDGDIVDLHFRGLVGLSDPIRATARDALAELGRAGVQVKMITGDHPSTAAAIAEQLGVQTSSVLTGPELEALGEEELAEKMKDVHVFARVTPSQKVRIVKALQRAGKVVGMTGDGANDAQAIRLADVGIALGDASTGAARLAADVVVPDGRVESIVAAVLEGRALWRSVREAVALLVGGNLGEIGFTVAGGVIGGRSPLNARQLLLVNMLTDSLPALAVSLRPPSSVSPEELLEEGPEASLGEQLERDIAIRGLVTGGAATGAWLLARALGDRRGADTVALLSLVGAQLGQTLVAGTRSPLVTATGLGSLAALIGIVQSPPLSVFFGCRPLGPIGLGQAALASGLATAAAWAAPKVLRQFEPAAEAVKVWERFVGTKTKSDELASSPSPGPIGGDSQSTEGVGR